MQAGKNEAKGVKAKSGKSPLSHATAAGSGFKPEFCLNRAGKKKKKEILLTMQTDPSFCLCSALLPLQLQRGLGSLRPAHRLFLLGRRL